jgi:hypothetical protein
MMRSLFHGEADSFWSGGKPRCVACLRGLNGARAGFKQAGSRSENRADGWRRGGVGDVPAFSKATSISLGLLWPVFMMR